MDNPKVEVLDTVPSSPMLPIQEKNSLMGETFGSASSQLEHGESRNDVDEEIKHLLNPKPMPHNFRKIEEKVRKSIDGMPIRRSILGDAKQFKSMETASFMRKLLKSKVGKAFS